MSAASEAVEKFHEDRMNLLALEAFCIKAHLSQSNTVHVTIPHGQRTPKGFPKVELLSVNPVTGGRNYSTDPLKVLMWMRNLWPSRNRT